MEDREILREHAILRATRQSDTSWGTPVPSERTLSATVRSLTCNGCPLRRATQSVQGQALEVLEYLNDSEAPLTDELVQFAEADRPEESVDSLTKCARTILRGNCDRYAENTETGCYIEVKGEL